MKVLKITFLYLLAFILISGGINHFAMPEYYNAFIPEGIDPIMANYFAGILEICLGVGLIILKSRRISALGITFLMIAFLPLHVIDVFVDEPAIGSKLMAYIRLPFQFLFIFWPWEIWKNLR